MLPKLNPGGIFITQSGPAGFLSCTEVFTCINATLKSVFPKVLPYAQHMPVFCDVWGWNMALTDPSQVDALTEDEFDSRVAARIEGPLRFLDGDCFKGLCHLNRPVREAIAAETQVCEGHPDCRSRGGLRKAWRQHCWEIAVAACWSLTRCVHDSCGNCEWYAASQEHALLPMQVYTADCGRFIHGKGSAENKGGGNTIQQQQNGQ